ncbi:MAG: hypothetical protein ACHP9Z_30615 [Streptosporangiales bacterium]
MTKFSAVKVKAESTLGMVVIGCTGTAAALSTLVLVFLVSTTTASRSRLARPPC